MITFDLQGINKARIWFEPSDRFLIGKHRIDAFYKFECDESHKCQDRAIILELFLPRGGRIIYGMLGVNYKSISDKILSIKIPETNNDIKVFDDSLIAPVEQAYIGLPIEYGKAIYLELIQFHKMKRLLLTGELDFCYAAHSEVSSNSWIFQKLTYILIKLLLYDKNIIDRQILIELLNQSQAKIFADLD